VIKYVGENVERMKRPTIADTGGLPAFTPQQVRSFRPIFGFLNDKDRDILYLIFVSRKRQIDVREILGRTQSSLAYDIKRIRNRLQFIHYLNKVFDIFLGFMCRERGEGNFTPEDMQVLILMFYTSSFTLTAQIIGTSQVRVRHSYTKSLRKMCELAEECHQNRDKDGTSMWFGVYEIFNIIRSRLNIIRRIYTGAKSRGRCKVSSPES